MDNNENNTRASSEAKAADELKKETMDTVNQVKETLKTVDLKKDAGVAKTFLIDMWNDPVGVLRGIVANPAGYIKIAVLLMGLWIVAVFADQCIISAIRVGFKDYFSNFLGTVLDIIKAIIAPAITIAVLSVIVFLLNKKKKFSLTAIITVMTIANIPNIVADVFRLIRVFSYSAINITSPVSYFGAVLSAVLVYFACKEINGAEDDKGFFKKFIIIFAGYCVVAIVFSMLGISI